MSASCVHPSLFANLNESLVSGCFGSSSSNRRSKICSVVALKCREEGMHRVRAIFNETRVSKTPFKPEKPQRRRQKMQRDWTEVHNLHILRWAWEMDQRGGRKGLRMRSSCVPHRPLRRVAGRCGVINAPAG